MGASSGERGNVLTSLWSVVLLPSVVLCGLMAGGGRTGAVGGDQPCRTERVLSQLFLSTGIDKSPVGGPQAHDDTHGCTTRWAQGDTRWQGYDPHRFVLDGLSLHDHQADGRERDGTAGMEQAEVADFHEAVREHVLEEPAEK